MTVLEMIVEVVSARGVHQGFLGALFAVVSVPFLRNTPIAKQILATRRTKDRLGLAALYLASGTLAGYICGQVVSQLPDQTLFLPGISFMYLAKFVGPFNDGVGSGLE